MKKIWSKLDKMEKIQLGGAAVAVVAAFPTFMTGNAFMAVALLVVATVITYVNVKKHV